MPIDTSLLQPRFNVPQVDVAGPMTAIGQGIANIVQQRRNQQALNAALPKLMGSDQDAAQSAIMGLFGVSPQLGMQAATAYKALHPEITPYQQFEEWATYNRLSDPYRDMDPETKRFCRQNPGAAMCQSAMSPVLPGMAQGTETMQAPPSQTTETPPTTSKEGPTPYESPQEMANQKVMDQDFIKKDFNTWNAGGYAESEHGLKALDTAISILKKNKNASGPFVGMGVLADPGSWQHAMVASYQPEALTAAAEHQRAVASSIRSLAGSRPSQRLYEAILRATYDPTAQPADNAQRLQLLRDNLAEQFKAKKQMAEYFKKYHTLKDYPGPTFDFDAASSDLEGQFPELKPSGIGLGDVMSAIPNIPSPISSVGLGRAGMAMGEATNQQPQVPQQAPQQAVGPMTGRSFVQPQAFTPSPLNAPPVPGATQPIQRDPRGAYLQGQRTTATGPNGHKIVLSPDGTYWIDTVTGKRLPQ